MDYQLCNARSRAEDRLTDPGAVASDGCDLHVLDFPRLGKERFQRRLGVERGVQHEKRACKQVARGQSPIARPRPRPAR